MRNFIVFFYCCYCIKATQNLYTKSTKHEIALKSFEKANRRHAFCTRIVPFAHFSAIAKFALSNDRAGIQEQQHQLNKPSKLFEIQRGKN